MLFVGRLLIALALSGTIASSLKTLPHQLAYFNEAAGGPYAGNQHLLGSSFDWGQDLLNASEYSQRHGVSEFILRSLCNPCDYLSFAQADEVREESRVIILTREMQAFRPGVRGSGDWRRQGPATELLAADEYHSIHCLSPTLYLSTGR
jgi:hypothetical protein